MSLPRAALRAAAVLCAAACARAPAPPEELDLAAALARAEVHREVGAIDLGSAGARPHLGAGWSFNERNAAGTSYVWAVGEVTELAFHLMRPRALDATLRLLPYPAPDSPPQTASMTLNGTPLATLTLRGGLHDYPLPLPAAATRAGRNVLRVRWGRHTRPSVAGASNDDRPLAAAWDLVTFAEVTGTPPGTPSPEVTGTPSEVTGTPVAEVTGTPPGAPSEVTGTPVAEVTGTPSGAPSEVTGTPSGTPSEVGGTLRIPFGTEVAWAFDRRADARLAVERLTLRGGGRLEVLVATDDGGEALAGTRDRGGEGWHLALPAGGGGDGPWRLALRAVAARPATAGGGAADGWRGALLLRPRLLTAEPAAAVLTPRPPAVPPARDVVLYLVDTLRADRLGCYGGDPALSPRIDALARQGVVFERARAQTSWTKPAVASALTGLGPLGHGVNEPEVGLTAEVSTLAERLAAAGYRTAAFVASAHVTEASGFAQGFEHFALAFDDAAAMTDRALAWLDGVEAGVPAFLFVHVVDPHAPFAPAADFRARFAARVADPAVGGMAALQAIRDRRLPLDERRLADLFALYDAEVAFTDHHFGRLLDGLQARGRDGDALIALVADHGEAFNEHGVLGHGWDLYREVVRVPLVMRLPGGAHAGARVARTATHADLLPTVLAATGVPAAHEVDGESLLAALAPTPAPPAPLTAYMDYQGRTGISVFDGRFELIVPLSASFAAGEALYDLMDDPGQTRNLIFARPVRAAWLRAHGRRARREAGSGRAAPVTLDDDLRRRLHALGYLDGG